MAVKSVGEVPSKPQVAKPLTPVNRLAALRSAAATVSGFDDARRPQPLALKPEAHEDRPAAPAAAPGVNKLELLRLKLRG